MIKRSDTIAAISTPHGRSGIGIIRVSGPKAIGIISSLAVSNYPLQSLAKEKNRKLIHATFYNLVKEKLDEVLVAYLPAKKSFTGEDTIEINCHGGRAILLAVLEAVIDSGARLAENGEFSRRAFENGRINLIQAEAINLLIHARTREAVKSAWRQIDGGLTRRIILLKGNLLSVYSQLQTQLDFETEDQDISASSIKSVLNETAHILKDIIGAAENKKYYEQGCWVVLYGPPNAGKSSLFNSILNSERALVNDAPGTTRDHISEVIDIEGIEVKMTDTAGVRDYTDDLERRAIARSLDQKQAADIILYVFDQSTEISKENAKEAKKILENDGFIIFNKSDLQTHESVIDFKDSNDSGNIIFLSSLNKSGIQSFLDKLAKRIANMVDYQENQIMVNLRQLDLIKKAFKKINEIIVEIEGEYKIDTIIYEINKIIDYLKEITGEITTNEVLDYIFSHFCIGK